MSNTLTEKKLPASFAGRHGDLVARLKKAEESRNKQASVNRNRFYFAVTALMAWYVCGPFVGAPPWHFVIQALGVFLVAFAVGALRVLESLIPLARTLASIRDALIHIEDEYGINFQKGEGDPVKKADALKSKASTDIDPFYKLTSEQLASVEGEVEKSLFGVYLELFGALKTSREHRPGNGG